MTMGNAAVTALTPGEPGYEEARHVWNGVIDRRPAMIVRCADTAAVVEALRLAREGNLAVSVRGGGHNVAGTAIRDDGVVVDLSEMNRVEVDPRRRVARAGGGATWADVDRATQRHGLATPGGVVSRTGIGGLTQGGGIGWLRRKHGLTADNLVGAEVVTADGRTVHTDDDPELLWGLRGGGGRLAVVTAFEFRLHPVGPELMFGFTFLPFRKAPKLLEAYRAFCGGAPEELSSLAITGTIPPEDSFPERTHGEDFVLFAGAYCGPVADGERAVRPLRELADPLIDLSGLMSFTDIQTVFDEDYPDGLRYYWKSTFLDDLGEEAIGRIIAHAGARPSALSTVDIWHMGGAIDRVDEEASAFAGRGRLFLLGVEANWTDRRHDEENIAWARECVQDMERFGGGRYLNFPGFHEEGDQEQRALLEGKQERLERLRRRYDPEGRLA